MKKFSSWLVLLLILAGCGQPSLSLPEVGEHQLLITHIKEPSLTVIDLVSEQIIHQEHFEFPVHCIEQVGSRYALLAGQHDPTILELDLEQGKLRKLQPDIASVTGLLYDQHEDILWIADRQRKEIVTFDLDAEQVLNRISLDHSPVALAVHERIGYVLTDGQAEIAVIDLTHYNVLQTFPVMERATDLIVLNGQIWVGGHGSNEELNEYVHVYDADSGKLLTKIKVGLMPIALHADPHQDEVWTISHGSNELHSIDPHSFTVRAQFPTGSNPYYLTADDQYIFVTALDGDRLTIVNRLEYTIHSELDVPAGPYGMIVGGRR